MDGHGWVGARQLEQSSSMQSPHKVGRFACSCVDSDSRPLPCYLPRLPCQAPQQFYGRKVTARQLLISGAVAPPPAAAQLYSALDALLEHAGAAGGPQFLSQASGAASEPSLHHDGLPLPPPTAMAQAGAAPASAPPLFHAGAGEEDEWEPEGLAQPAATSHHYQPPRQPQPQQWGRHDVYGSADAAPRSRSMPAFLDDDGDEPQAYAYGSLFD
jgi:hypothetical protein